MMATGLIETFDGARIAWTSAGTGTTDLVFIHGWACNQDYWRYQMQDVPSRFRAIALDLPGHGLAKPGRSGRDWTIEEFGRDVATIVDRLGSQDVILVGHSAGGAVAVEAAAIIGERSRAVLGVDTFTYETIYPRIPEASVAEMAAALRADFVGVVRAMVTGLFPAGSDPALVEWVAESMSSVDPETAIPAIQGLLRWDMETRMRQRRMPIKTINALPFLADGVAGRYVELFDTITMPDVGHFLMLEKPEAFQALLLDILQTL